MFPALRRFALLLAATSLLCLGSDADKPACTRDNAGQLWPEAANHDAKERRRLAQCGELELCARGIWRYHWEPLTVRFDQLNRNGRTAKPAGCEILPQELSSGDRRVSDSSGQ